MVTFSVVEALERDLACWSKKDPAIGASAWAALALALAEKLDDPGTSPNAAAMVANSLKDVLVELRGLIPAAGKGNSPLDEIRARRENRLTAAKNRVGS